MDKRRKTFRLSINEIPEILRKPVLLYNFEEVKSEVENLSPLGIGLVVDRNSQICTGDFIYLKYPEIDSDIKCYCVYCDDDENGKSIGAYFTEPEDKELILSYLHFQNEN